VVLLDASSAVAIDRLAELLPPPGEWYSGLLAYPLLLPAQVVILLAMVELNRRVGGGRGLASRPRPRLGRALCVLAALYASVMLVRYGISSATHPDRRLLPPGIIPIVFHWVLAAYLATLGAVALGRPRGAG
jgi:hypothetical protein